MVTEKVRTEQEQRQFEVAAEILNQLGGRRFLAMTSCKKFLQSIPDYTHIYKIINCANGYGRKGENNQCMNCKNFTPPEITEL